MATVTISGTYVNTSGTAAFGHVLFAPKLPSGAWGNAIRADLNTAGTIGVTVPVGLYLVTERVGVTSRDPYSVYLAPALSAGGYSVTPVASSGGFTPAETLALTPGTFTYVIPASANMLYFEVLAGGGGGGSGSTRSGQHQVGGGGGGGGGRTTKMLNAAALRAAFPSGLSYTVGGGGLGAIANVTPTSDGTTGAAGGFSFVQDFIVATPGNGTFLAQGGGIPAGGLQGFGGSQGYGDTDGSNGGYAGGIAQFYLSNSSTGAGGAGGYPIPQFGFTNGIQNATVLVLAGGGGVGGGGGGGVASGVAYNGGDAGFATTTDTSPLTGTGGVVGGAAAGTGGATSVPGVAGGGGGGGGAASLTTNGQPGANALANTGAGGGGGGPTDHSGSSGGAGGNGGSGYVRIIAY